MRKKMTLIYSAVIIFSLILTACSQKEKTVIVYTSVDRNYSEQVFKDFENKTGIKVKAVYDTEASKTTGMVNRLIAEKENPVADVFWNGEFAQTILLKEKGILARHTASSAYDIPEKFKDAEGYWTAFGGRARCIIINTELMQENDYPSSIYDFTGDKYDAERIAMAKPVFGTTATHAAALFSLLGDEKAQKYYQDLYDRGVRIVDGNGAVRDLVAAGELYFGMTDTDDALGAVKKGKPVKIIFPDQEGMGTLIVPNTAALVKGSKNTEEAEKFLEYICSKETEKYLTEIGWCQVTVRDVEAENKYFDASSVKSINISLTDVYSKIEEVNSILREMFVR